ncbi:MAG: hypothetical protein R3300_04745 [Candidatus Promineifilaceae bacterium]|nr:hypothetical protein [Candidatus Promineifilaceae bacterium]
MRFLIREQEFERSVASGEFAYQRNQQSASIRELWRATAPAEGYRFLRVDLDGRAGLSGNSYLFHATLTAVGKLERLKLRVFGPQLRLEGDLLPQDGSLTAVFEINDRPWETELELPANCPVWFPSATGLGLLAKAVGHEGSYCTVALNQQEQFKPELRHVDVRLAESEEVQVGRHHLLARPYSISWSDQQRHVWLDDYGWPVRAERGDGLVAEETQYIRHTV